MQHRECGDVSTRPPKFRGAPAVVRAIDPAHGIEVGAKKGVAPQQRSDCLFDIVRPDDPHREAE